MKNVDLCSTCQINPPLGMVGSYYYKNCNECIDKLMAKQQANKKRKNDAFKAKMQAAGK